MSQHAPVRAVILGLFALSAIVSPVAAQSIGLNFTGITSTQGAALSGNGGYAPPDNAGAVGQSHIVQLINGAYAVYDKSNGNQIFASSGRQFWTSANVDPGNGISNLGAFNQRILYDPTVDRWIAVALTADSVDNRVMVARSNTGNPLDGWKAVSFVGNVGGTGRFVDYTGLGIDANGVYITTNNFESLAGGLDSVSVFSLPKADLLAAEPALTNLSRYDGLISGIQPFVGWTLQPVVDFGPAKNHAPIFATGLTFSDNYLYRTDLTNTAGPGAQLTPEAALVEVDSYEFPPDAGQPDGTRTIGLIDHRIKSHVLQVGDMIYAVQDVEVGANAGIRWYKIDETTNEVVQSGTIADANYDYYQASIGANANGDVVIGYNRSGLGPDGQISIFASLGSTLGELTTFGDPFLLLAGNVDNYHYFNSRWGDYTTTLADPFNPNAFWTFQAIPLEANAWATHITQILVPEPAGYVLAGTALLAVFIVARRTRRRAVS